MEVSFTPWSLYPRDKSPRYPLHRRRGGPKSRPGYGVEKKNFQPPPGIEPRSSDRPARSRSLYQVNYPDSSLHISRVYIWPARTKIKFACQLWIYNPKTNLSKSDQQFRRWHLRTDRHTDMTCPLCVLSKESDYNKCTPAGPCDRKPRVSYAV
jgi:hypothetical protein